MNNFGGRAGGLRSASVLLLLTLVGFGLAACGNDTPSKVVATIAETGTDPSTAPSADKGNSVAYSQCMRANGVPDFPDPDQGGKINLGSGGGKAGAIDPESREFKSASEKCKQYMGTGVDPSKGNQQTDPWSADKKLAYSKCMRENGLPTFPDPDKDGRFTQSGSGSKIDSESPEFKKADKACASYKPQGDVGGAPGGGGK